MPNKSLDGMNQKLNHLLSPHCATEQPLKRHRGEGEPGFSKRGREEMMETESGLFGRRAPPGRKQATPAAKKGQQGSAEALQTTQDHNLEQRNDNSSVFVSNLAFTLEEPEKKLKELFDACGPIQQVRPVFSVGGTFRGYCYVQFEGQASVTEALKLDRQEVEGRPMFVSPCVDKNKNPEFKVN